MINYWMKWTVNSDLKLGDLFYWLSGEKQVPEHIKVNPEFAKLQKLMLNQDKQVLRMPDL